MTAPISSSDLDRLRRNRRRVALVIVVSVLAVLVGVGGLVASVASLERRKATLARDVRALDTAIAVRTAELGRLRDDAGRAQVQVAQGEVAAASATLGEIAGGVSPETGDATGTTTGADPDAAPRTDARAPVQRVYFQIRNLGQIEAYRACRSPLSQAGFRVPDFERVARGPERAEIRYFHDEDQARATELQGLLRTCLARSVELKRVRISGVNRLQFEVWLEP